MSNVSEQPRPIHGGDPCSNAQAGTRYRRVRETVRLRLVPTRTYQPSGPIQRFLATIGQAATAQGGTQTTGGGTVSHPSTIPFAIAITCPTAGAQIVPTGGTATTSVSLQPYDEVSLPRERLIHVTRPVAGQDGDALVFLHALQQVADLEVCVAVVRVPGLRSLSEERIRLVEEQHRAGGLRLVEQQRQVLLRLADILVHHARQIHAIQIERQRARQHLRRHRLPGPGRPAEQHCQTAPYRHPAAKTPTIEHLALVTHPNARQLKFLPHRWRHHHQIVPCA